MSFRLLFWPYFIFLWLIDGSNKGCVSDFPISQNQWHEINSKFSAVVISDVRNGKDRVREWVVLSGNFVFLRVVESMTDNKETRYIFTGDSAFIPEI